MNSVSSGIHIPILAQVVAGRAPPIEPLTISQVEQMMVHGILHEGAPIELIDGLLVRKDRSARGSDPMTHSPRHASCVAQLQQLAGLVQSLGFRIWSQLPVALTDKRAPEPDWSVIYDRGIEYGHRHPGPADIVAIVEVAESSLEYDQSTKQSLYAEAEIPVYWIVNLCDNVVEVYQDPDPVSGTYRMRQDWPRGHRLELSLPNGKLLAVPVDDLIR